MSKSKIPQKVFAANRMSVSYPTGYQTFDDYIATLETNLHFAKGNPLLLKHVPRIEESLATAKKARGY